MRIGELRHRVTVQYKVTTIDAYGAEAITWTDLLTCWAAVEPLSGREFLEGRNLEDEVNYRIRIRYRSGLDPTMRVSWGPATGGGTRVFDIEAVLERYSERREIWLMCREVVEE